MSEYQYYEFHAIDRRLTSAQMGKLQAVSSRGRITPTSFVNEYEYGDFKGDPDAWLQEYFDAHLYFANWGTHILMIALPARLLPVDVAAEFGVDDVLEVRKRKERVVLTFHSEDEDGHDWDDDDPTLASMVGVRAELARGDLRALYLGWLAGAEYELEDDVIEPPAPPGLKSLTPCLECMADFLRVNRDLLHVAAKASADEADTSTGRRTVGQLREAAQARAQKRERAEAAAEARRKAKAERAAALAKEARLNAMRGREQEVWAEVDALVRTRLPKSYDQAVRMVGDLKALGGDFRQRLIALRAAHAGKQTFLAKLRQAGL